VRLYVVNVGVNVADATRRGMRSPIFTDGTFEFVPIKESRAFAACPEVPRYCELSTHTGRAVSLAAYVPEKIAEYRVHNDPEFETCTYGDVMSARAANLKYVVESDQLWFLARLWNHDGLRWEKESDFYFIGRFEVEQNVLVASNSGPGDFSADLLGRIECNAHYRRWVYCDGWDAFRVITGKRPGSARFRRALRVTPEVAGLLFGGAYDRKSDGFRSGNRLLKNRNGTPRLFARFGSVTRAVQSF
jgi:Nucleotide modification associated domain 3